MKINLLPRAEYLKYIDKKELVKRFVAGVLVSVAVIVVINVILVGVVSTRQMILDKLTTAHKEYSDLQGAIRQAEKDVVFLQEKKTVLSGFLERKFFWSEKLFQFAKIIPEEVWMEEMRIETNLNDQKGILRLRGNLFTLEGSGGPISVLNNFIKSLSTREEFIRDFEGVKLVDMQIGNYQKSQIVRFNLELPLRGGKK